MEILSRSNRVQPLASDGIVGYVSKLGGLSLGHLDLAILSQEPEAFLTLCCSFALHAFPIIDALSSEASSLDLLPHSNHDSACQKHEVASFCSKLPLCSYTSPEPCFQHNSPLDALNTAHELTQHEACILIHARVLQQCFGKESHRLPPSRSTITRPVCDRSQLICLPRDGYGCTEGGALPTLLQSGQRLTRLPGSAIGIRLSDVLDP